MLGTSWESFVMQEISRLLDLSWDHCFYWPTHRGAELDLLVLRGTERLGFELKRTSSPRTTRSMRSALADLELDRLYVVHPGEGRFPLGERIEALGLSAAHRDGVRAP